MTLIEKIESNYRQIIYLLLFIVLIIPLKNPIGLPILMSDSTMGVYNEIDALKPGDVAVLSNGMASAHYSQLYPQYTSVLEHLLRKEGVKILLIDEGLESPIFTKQAINELNVFERNTYGEEIVYLGYLAGQETMISGVCRDLHSLVNVDYEGTKLSELSMMDEINDAGDFTMVIMWTAGPSTQFWLNHAWAPFGVKVGFALTGTKVPADYPYFTSGQVFGILESSRGAAEYEILLHKPGIAVKGMDAQSIAHVYCICLIVVGNIIYISKRRTDK